MSEIEAIAGQRLGLRLDGPSLDRVRDAVRQRMADMQCRDPVDYLGRLDRAELDELTELVSVGETFFFRNPQQFRVLAETAVPWAKKRGRLRMLSAGCSTGEEPYTMAMVLRDCGVEAHELVAVDVSAAALQIARAGRYRQWSLRATPEPVRRRYFAAERQRLVLAPSVRNSVRFERRNLLSDDGIDGLGGPFEVVFCRNLLMYLSEATARDLIARLHRALVPGGFLFVGHAETLWGWGTQLAVQRARGAFYYRRLPFEGGVPRRTVADPGAASGSTAEFRPRGRGDWRRQIERSSRRIRGLTASTGEPLPDRTDQRSHHDALARARELFALEQFAAAVRELEPLPPSAERGHLLAMSLLVAGELERALAIGEGLLASDDLDPDARLIMALCAGQLLDPDDARCHFQAAVYLDPRFAMAHLHDGRARARRGDAAGAAVCFERALVLLPHESDQRIQLFGGGFGRHALADLCRSELAGHRGAR